MIAYYTDDVGNPRCRFCNSIVEYIVPVISPDERINIPCGHSEQGYLFVKNKTGWKQKE